MGCGGRKVGTEGLIDRRGHIYLRTSCPFAACSSHSPTLKSIFCTGMLLSCYVSLLAGNNGYCHHQNSFLRQQSSSSRSGQWFLLDQDGETELAQGFANFSSYKVHGHLYKSLVKNDDSDSAGLGRSLRICVSNRGPLGKLGLSVAHPGSCEGLINA